MATLRNSNAPLPSNEIRFRGSTISSGLKQAGIQTSRLVIPAAIFLSVIFFCQPSQVPASHQPISLQLSQTSSYDDIETASSTQQPSNKLVAIGDQDKIHRLSIAQQQPTAENSKEYKHNLSQSTSHGPELKPNSENLQSTTSDRGIVSSHSYQGTNLQPIKYPGNTFKENVVQYEPTSELSTSRKRNITKTSVLLSDSTGPFEGSGAGPSKDKNRNQNGEKFDDTEEGDDDDEDYDYPDTLESGSGTGGSDTSPSLSLQISKAKKPDSSEPDPLNPFRRPADKTHTPSVSYNSITSTTPASTTATKVIYPQPASPTTLDQQTDPPLSQSEVHKPIAISDLNKKLGEHPSNEISRNATYGGQTDNKPSTTSPPRKQTTELPSRTESHLSNLQNLRPQINNQIPIPNYDDISNNSSNIRLNNTKLGDLDYDYEVDQDDDESSDVSNFEDNDGSSESVTNKAATTTMTPIERITVALKPSDRDPLNTLTPVRFNQINATIPPMLSSTTVSPQRNLKDQNQTSFFSTLYDKTEEDEEDDEDDDQDDELEGDSEEDEEDQNYWAGTTETSSTLNRNPSRLPWPSTVPARKPQMRPDMIASTASPTSRGFDPKLPSKTKRPTEPSIQPVQLEPKLVMSVPTTPFQSVETITGGAPKTSPTTTTTSSITTTTTSTSTSTTTTSTTTTTPPPTTTQNLPIVKPSTSIPSHVTSFFPPQAKPTISPVWPIYNTQRPFMIPQFYPSSSPTAPTRNIATTPRTRVGPMMVMEYPSRNSPPSLAYEDDTDLTRQIYEKAVEVYHATNKAIAAAVEAVWPPSFEFNSNTIEPLLERPFLFMLTLGAAVMGLVLTMMLLVYLVTYQTRPSEDSSYHSEISYRYG